MLKKCSHLLLLILLISSMYPFFTTHLSYSHITIHNKVNRVEDKYIPNNELIFNNTVTNERLSNQIGLSQNENNDLGVPLNLLYELLEIPIQRYELSHRLLIIGDPFPVNFTNRFDGRLEVNYIDTEHRAPGNNSEITGIMDYMLNTNYSIFSNLQINWVSIEFSKLSNNATYQMMVDEYIEEQTLADYKGMLILGEYEGNPIDDFSWEISTFNTLDKFVLSYADLIQRGGSMLSPSANPNTISITNLKGSGSGYESYSNLSMFDSSLDNAALSMNKFERVGTDFAIPGETLLLTNSSRQFPSGEVIIHSSKYFPLITFALGLLTMMENSNSSVSTQKLIQKIIDNSVDLPLKTSSIGYGIPRFSLDVVNNTRYFRDFTLDPFNPDKSHVVVTTGQIISPTIEVVPYFEEITLKSIEITYEDNSILKNFNIASEKIFVDTLSQQYDRFEPTWVQPEIIQPSFSVEGIPENKNFEIQFNFDFDGEVISKSFTGIIDNDKKLAGIPTYTENDGLFDRDDVTGRFYPTFQGLYDLGWSFSFLRNPTILEREIEKMDHDIVLIIDPELITIDDTDIFSKYIENGGNLIIFPDYQNPLRLRSSSDNQLLQYENPSENLIEWLATRGMDIQPWDHTEYPTLLVSRETNSFESSSNFYYITWEHNISYLDSFELIPFRGYQIDKQSTFNSSISSELGSFLTYALSSIYGGHISVMGSISPLIPNFSDIGFDIPQTNQVHLMDNLLTFSSGRIANLSASLQNNSPKSGVLNVEIDVTRAFATQSDRWGIAIQGSHIIDKSLTLDEVTNNKVITVFPKVGYSGSSNFTVDLLFNNRVVESFQLEFIINVPLSSLVVLLVIWLGVSIVGYLLYYKKQYLETEMSN